MGLYVLDDKNIKRRFFAKLDNAEAGSWASLIGTPISSNRAVENYKWLGASPMMREWIGGRLLKRPRVESYDVPNLPFEASFGIPIEDLDRDDTGMINARIDDLAVRTAQHWEKLQSDLINVSESTVCYDGQFFIDTDHVSGDSGTQTNDFTTTEVPSSNVTTTTAMTGTEAANVIMEMISRMLGFKDDQGEPINQNAKQFVAMASPGHAMGLWTALSAQFLTNGVTNPLLASGFQVMPVINPRLTLTTKVFVFRADGTIKPFINQSEQEVQVKTVGRDSEYAFDNRQIKVGVEARRNVGYGLWEHASMVVLT